MREETIFAAALGKANQAERAAYVDAACGDDAELRGRVYSLLAAHEQAGQFLANPAVEQLAEVASATGAQTAALESGAETPAAPTGDETRAEPAGAADVVLAFLTPSPKPDVLGRLAHYEVLEVIGKGAFGAVLKAFDEKLHRVVAIKVLAAELAANGTARKRFLREARAAAAVRNEHIIDIHAVEEEPIPYIVMEYVEGQTLQQKLDATGPLEVKEILRIGYQTACGLAAAHKQGQIHRDIKPSNILLENGVERVKISDFGLARAIDDASVTQSGVVAGTPMYMAPEQAAGEPLDHRADLFSLGSTLYVMCTGRPPFRASGTMAVLKRVCEDTPRPIREVNSEIPEWLCDIIAKLHAKKPEDRYASAREVADVLAGYLTELQLHGQVLTREGTGLGVAGAEALRSSGKAAAASQAAVAASPSQPRPIHNLIAGVAVGLVTLVMVVGVTIVVIINQFRAHDPPPPQHPGVKPVLDPEPGWVQLFNGKDLTGWKTHPAHTGNWKVENGKLVGSGHSMLFSERGDYENFHYRVEGWFSRGMDSGQFFRCDFGAVCEKGYEAQIGSNTGTLFRFSNQGLVTLKQANVAIPTITSFTQEVIANGATVVVKLNGQTIAEVVDNHHRRGHLALQSLSKEGTVHFSKIEIKELPAEKTSQPPLAVAPFTAAKAKEHQDAWAKHLGVPVEIENSIGMKLRLIPPGEFTMGYTKEEMERLLPEVEDKQMKNSISLAPAKQTRIAEPFYLGIHEVTVDQFRGFVKGTGYRTTAERDGKGGWKWDIVERKYVQKPEYIWSYRWPWTSDDSPVVNITGEDAEAFCAWLSQRDGRQYVLPREQQWEYACRAGTTTLWWTGDSTEALLLHDRLGGTNAAQVGSLRPNPFGLYDMHGNVMEWARTAVLYQVRGGCSGDNGFLPHSAFRPRLTRSTAEAGFRVAIVGDLKAKTPLAAEPWVQLFNGRDLTGWKSWPAYYRPWKVESGVLSSAAGRTQLHTVRGDYENFHLRVEAKYSAKSHCNLLFRSKSISREDDVPDSYVALISPGNSGSWGSGCLQRLTAGLTPVHQNVKNMVPPGPFNYGVTS